MLYDNAQKQSAIFYCKVVVNLGYMHKSIVQSNNCKIFKTNMI